MISFSIFLPNKVNNIQISSIGTDKGMPGNFTYAIYNSNIISHEKVLKILEKPIEIYLNDLIINKIFYLIIKN